MKEFVGIIIMVLLAIIIAVIQPLRPLEQKKKKKKHPAGVPLDLRGKKIICKKCGNRMTMRETPKHKIIFWCFMCENIVDAADIFYPKKKKKRKKK